MCDSNQLTNDLGLTDKNHACACATDSHVSAASDSRATPRAEVIREHYLVEGMICSHCVASVTEEVSELAGVESVSVDLQVGGASRIMAVSNRPVPAEQVREAVIEAGYTLVAG